MLLKLTRGLRTGLLLVCIGMLMTGCISWAVNPSPEASAAARRTALEFKADAGYAVLYLYRPKYKMQISLHASFRINDQHLGELQNGYFRVNLRPGKHFIHSFRTAEDEVSYYPKKAVSTARKRVITVASGDVVYMHAAWDSTALSVVNARQGQSAIKQLRFYQGDFLTMNDVFQTTEDLAWEACAQSKSAMTCRDFMRKYPSTRYQAQAQQVIEDVERATMIGRVKQNFIRDGGLPVEVRRDKYMVALTSHLKNERFKEALVYFEALEKLDIELSSSFNYFYGESLLKTGNPGAAITKLYAYISEAGSGGKYYKKALELANEAEAIE